MLRTTNSLVARVKKMLIPAGCASAVVLAGALVFNYSEAHAAIGAAAPLDESAVSPLTALDNAVEAVAARVTPAVVNVAVTSRPSSQEADGDDDGGGAQGPGSISPNDLPPGLRQFFFGPNGPGSGRGCIPVVESSIPATLCRESRNAAPTGPVLFRPMAPGLAANTTCCR